MSVTRYGSSKKHACLDTGTPGGPQMPETRAGPPLDIFALFVVFIFP